MISGPRLRNGRSAPFGGSSSSPLFVRLGHALGLRQPRPQDPHELCRRIRAHPGPRVRQVVLHRRVRQAQPVGGRLLRPGDQDRRDHDDLAIGGALGGAGRPSRHALRTSSRGTGGCRGVALTIRKLSDR
jgi:hypothetical protein